MASYGSIALFHMPGVTPEAILRHSPAASRARPDRPGDIDAFLASYDAEGDKVDVVVFAAPQLSLIEMAAVADALDGRRVHSETTLLVTTSPEIKSAADRMGLTARIEAAGGVVAVRHLLLPELCRRARRSKRLDPAPDQFGEAHQHHRRLRLQPDAGQPRTLHRLGRRGAHRLMPRAPGQPPARHSRASGNPGPALCRLPGYPLSRGRTNSCRQ